MQCEPLDLREAILPDSKICLCPRQRWHESVSVHGGTTGSCGCGLGVMTVEITLVAPEEVNGSAVTPVISELDTYFYIKEELQAGGDKLI